MPSERGRGARLDLTARTEHARRMPQSLSSLLAHIVFSTKGREPLILDELREDLHAYIGGILINCGGTLLAAGSVADHIHLLVSHPRVESPAELIKRVKIGTSLWIKERDRGLSGFYWQNGYGIFSISPSHRAALEKYIAHQAEHHRTITFQEEYRRILTRYGVEWDERYVWELKRAPRSPSGSIDPAGVTQGCSPRLAAPWAINFCSFGAFESEALRALSHRFGISYQAPLQSGGIRAGPLTHSRDSRSQVIPNHFGGWYHSAGINELWSRMEPEESAPATGDGSLRSGTILCRSVWPANAS